MKVTAIRILLLFAVVFSPNAISHSFLSQFQELNSPCCPVNAGYSPQATVYNAETLSTHSWEFGTTSEALLELFDAELSVFGPNPFPNGQLPVPSVTGTRSLAYAKPNIRLQIPPGQPPTLSDGQGAVGDPASLGISALLIGQSLPEYHSAAVLQANHILHDVPRFWNGAISQRENAPELWADYLYMAPPFLAYYAVATSDVELMKETVRQCGLYRQVLQANTTLSYHGLWEHIVGPQSSDPGLWSTGNGWAAMGMVRVLATVMKWDLTSQDFEMQSDLEAWITEILQGAMKVDTNVGEPGNGLLRNYLDNPTWFGEISGTSALAAATYRLATLTAKRSSKHALSVANHRGIRNVIGPVEIAWADGLRFAAAKHVDAATGIGSPAVNPLGWWDTTPFTTGSPEGQSFLTLMYAAYRDCVGAGVCA